MQALNCGTCGGTVYLDVNGDLSTYVEKLHASSYREINEMSLNINSSAMVLLWINSVGAGVV